MSGALVVVDMTDDDCRTLLSIGLGLYRNFRFVTDLTGFLTVIYGHNGQILPKEEIIYCKEHGISTSAGSSTIRRVAKHYGKVRNH